LAVGKGHRAKGMGLRAQALQTEAVAKVWLRAQEQRRFISIKNICIFEKL
jgi:hypothetical protein